MAKINISKDHLYVRGAARFKDLVYLSVKDRKLAKKDLAHSLLGSIYQGSTATVGKAQWATAGMCVVKKPVEKLVVVSPNGEVLTYVGGKSTDERLKPKPDEIRFCGAIGGYAYACGMGRQVYVRESEGSWRDMSAPEGDRKRVSGFEAIDGFSTKNIYAVGWEGEIWQYVKNKWVERTTPVNVILTGVCCAPDENVYVCGQQGTLLKGSGETWEVLEQGGLEDDFWDIRAFKGKIYVSSMTFLYELKGKKLVPVNFGKDAPDSCYKLTDAEGVLWSIGQEDVFSFDGKSWTRWD